MDDTASQCVAHTFGRCIGCFIVFPGFTHSRFSDHPKSCTNHEKNIREEAHSGLLASQIAKGAHFEFWKGAKGSEPEFKKCTTYVCDTGRMNFSLEP